jgi:hypothetical protein
MYSKKKYVEKPKILMLCKYVLQYYLCLFASSFAKSSIRNPL